MAKNVAASVSARLRNLAGKDGAKYNKILDQYAHERFLYRLSESAHKDKLILKGALLYIAYGFDRSRPTRDMDFMGGGASNSVESVKRIIEEIASIEYNDGVQFDFSNSSAEEITENDKYHGVRVKFICSILTMKIRMQIDVGFGDKIVQGPVEIDYPVLLDSPSPKIFIYSLETAVAEKFEAIVSLNIKTSRYKDFYDVLAFAENYRFTREILFEALSETFNNRQTNIDDRASIFSQEYKNSKDNNMKWVAFLNRNNIASEYTFSQCLEKIEGFIEPLLKDASLRKWNYDIWRWE